MTSGPTIDYEALQQEAMRGVIKAVLSETAKSGLPGDHHFYISFNTRAPSVGLSRRLREKYPQEMTIVLQHRFWGLTVFDDRFEVNLTFDNIPERLVIPFQAIRVFVDPSVRFGLQFETPDLADVESESTTEQDRADGASPSPAPRLEIASPPSPAPQRKPRTPRKTRGDKAASGSDENQSTPAATEAESTPAAAKERVPELQVEAPLSAANGDAKVVSLDAFRKR